MNCSKRIGYIAMLLLAGSPVHAAETPLTTDGLLKRDPAFWAGKLEIVYTVEVPSGRMKLVRLDLATGKSELLHPDPALSDREFNSVGDGSLYAHNSIVGGKGTEGEMIVVDAATGNKTRSPSGVIHWPNLTADGKRLLYSNGALQLWTVDWTVGARPEKGKPAVPVKSTVQSLKFDGLYPRLIPEDRGVVCASFQDGDMEIYRLDLDGKNVKRLTTSRGIDTQPSVSPDGNHIAFVSNRDGNYEIYVMDADGSNARRITNNPERDECPVWHPDGKHLIFVGERKGRFDLYQVDVR